MQMPIRITFLSRCAQGGRCRRSRRWALRSLAALGAGGLVVFTAYTDIKCHFRIWNAIKRQCFEVVGVRLLRSVQIGAAKTCGGSLPPWGERGDLLAVFCSLKAFQVYSC